MSYMSVVMSGGMNVFSIVSIAVVLRENLDLVRRAIFSFSFEGKGLFGTLKIPSWSYLMSCSSSLSVVRRASPGVLGCESMSEYVVAVSSSLC